MKAILSIIVAGMTLTACAEMTAMGETSTSWTYHGKRYSQTLREADLKQYPEWEPEKKPSPLSFSKAIQLARAHLRGRFPDVAEWTFKGASIHRFSKGKWYFEISFDDGNPDVHGDTAIMNPMNVIVCFNGWIPNIEEEHPKD